MLDPRENPAIDSPAASEPSGNEVSETAGLQEPLALHSTASHLRFWIVAVLGLTADLLSKYEAFFKLRQGGSVSLIPDVLDFHTTMNPGALFGIGAGRTELFLIASVVALVLVLWMFAQCPARRWMTQIALAGILAGALGNMYDRINVRLVPYVFATEQGRAVLYCEKHLSTEGDRVMLVEYPATAESARVELSAEAATRLPDEAGYVRDFIKISKKWFGGKDVWPWVFNVADMLLVGGVGILAIRMLFERSPQSERKPQLDVAGPAS